MLVFFLIQQYNNWIYAKTCNKINKVGSKNIKQSKSVWTCMIVLDVTYFLQILWFKSKDDRMLESYSDGPNDMFWN